jgi:hypothetical protein
MRVHQGVSAVGTATVSEIVSAESQILQVKSMPRAKLNVFT